MFVSCLLFTLIKNRFSTNTPLVHYWLNDTSLTWMNKYAHVALQGSFINMWRWLQQCCPGWWNSTTDSSVVLKSPHYREELLLFRLNKEVELNPISKGYGTSFFTHFSNFTPCSTNLIVLFGVISLDSWISRPHVSTSHPQTLITATICLLEKVNESKKINICFFMEVFYVHLIKYYLFFFPSVFESWIFKVVQC